MSSYEAPGALCGLVRAATAPWETVMFLVRGPVVMVALVLCAPPWAHAEKWYNEWDGDPVALSGQQNFVKVGTADPVAAHAEMLEMIALGYKICPRLSVRNPDQDWHAAVDKVAEAVEGIEEHCIFTYLIDEPGLSGWTPEELEALCDYYDSVLPWLPGFIGYSGRSAEWRTFGIPDSLKLVGMFCYPHFTSRLPDEVQRLRFDRLVPPRLEELKSLANGRKIHLIGESCDYGGKLPSPEQQQWYIDLVRNDPDVFSFQWYRWGAIQGDPDLVAAHVEFGHQLTGGAAHNIQVSVDPSLTSATVTWQTEYGVDSGDVEYGTTPAYGQVVADATPGSADHEAVLGGLLPGTQYFYKVCSHKAGEPDEPWSGTFSTGVGSLAGTVVDDTGAPVDGATVTLQPGGYSAETSSTGSYAISDVPVGSYEVTAELNGLYFRQTVCEVRVPHGATAVQDFLLLRAGRAFVNGGFEAGLRDWQYFETDPDTVYGDGYYAVPSHGGVYWVGWFSCGYGRGGTWWGYYQKFPTEPGRRYTAGVYIYTAAWDSYENHPDANKVRIGLNRAGLDNPYDWRTTWSAWSSSDQHWSRITTAATAGADTMTLFVMMQSPEDHEWNFVCADDAELLTPVPTARTSPPGLLRKGWNLIGLPLDTGSADVSDVLRSLAGAGNTLENAVYAYDSAAGYRIYPSDFTTMQPGAGYWLYLDAAATATVVGEEVSNLHIPLSGWTLFGYPYDEPQSWKDCLVTDGSTTMTVLGAEWAGWIQGTIFAYDGAYTTVAPDGSGDDDSLRPWRGYWLLAVRPGLELILDAP